MDTSITGIITKIASPETVIDRQTNQPNGAVRHRFLVEEQGAQYPDSVVIEIYDKMGDGSTINNLFQPLGIANAYTVGTVATFHFHLRGSIGVSQKTGKEYSINDAARLWKVESANAQQPQSAAQQFAQPAPGYPAQQAPQPAQQPWVPQQQPQFNGQYLFPGQTGGNQAPY